MRVTNLSNGRSVLVTINDRGPYIRGRHIDLSVAAARAIGMLNRGVAAGHDRSPVAVLDVRQARARQRLGKPSCSGLPATSHSLARRPSLRPRGREGVSEQAAVTRRCGWFRDVLPTAREGSASGSHEATGTTQEPERAEPDRSLRVACPRPKTWASGSCRRKHIAGPIGGLGGHHQAEADAHVEGAEHLLVRNVAQPLHEARRSAAASANARCRTRLGRASAPD